MKAKKKLGVVHTMKFNVFDLITFKALLNKPSQSMALADVIFVEALSKKLEPLLARFNDKKPPIPAPLNPNASPEDKEHYLRLVNLTMTQVSKEYWPLEAEVVVTEGELEFLRTQLANGTYNNDPMARPFLIALTQKLGL